MIDYQAVLGIGGLVVSISAAILVFVRGRGDTQAKLTELMNTQVREELTRLYTRIDEVEAKAASDIAAVRKESDRKVGAASRLLRMLVRQWPDKTVIPDLNPDDIAEFENTIPAEWIRDLPKGSAS